MLSSFLMSLILLSASAACSSEAAVSPPACTVTITEDAEFHQISLNISIDDFNQLGFRYGDSCDILFPDGNLLKDIPYYNGYYCRTGQTQIVSYPGDASVGIAVCNSEPAWEVYRCREGDSVTVTLAEAGKYSDIQDALNTVYSNDRADYPDDAAFANFRVMSGGRLKKGLFFRGASPVNDAYHRARFVDALIRETGILFVLDLADTEEKIRIYAETSQPEYFLSLHDAGLVAPLGLTASFMTGDFLKSLASGLREMVRHEGPYYIHCLEGKDRTGFVCLLLEALCGADESELEADYMKTYANYYGIVPGSKQYNAILDIKFRDIAGWLAGLGDGSTEAGARACLFQSGMSEKEIDDLEFFLSEK